MCECSIGVLLATTFNYRQNLHVSRCVATPCARLDVGLHAHVRVIPFAHRFAHRIVAEQYAVAASDFARIALLATHGGLYADLDFIVVRPLHSILTLLQTYEIVSYSSNADNCTRGFTSNFAAARPGSALWAETWKSLREQLTRRCGTKARHKICCYSAGNAPVPCRVPWAITDKLMEPISKRYAATGRWSVYCHAGSQSFTPHASGYRCSNIFHIQSLPLTKTQARNDDPPTRHVPAVAHRPDAEVGGRDSTRWHGTSSSVARHSKMLADVSNTIGEGSPVFELAADNLGCSSSPLHCARSGDDLRCHQDKGHVAVSQNFYGRVAYHLFESIYGSLLAATPRVEASQSVFGSLYRLALRDVPTYRLPPPFAMRQRVQLKSEATHRPNGSML